MNAVRTASWLGLAIAAALAIWWLPALQFALANGFATQDSSIALLGALWLARAAGIVVVGFVTSQCVIRMTQLTPLLCLAWLALPLVALAAAAAGISWTRVASGELLLVLLALLVWRTGHGLRRLAARTSVADPLTMAAGICFAAAIWSNRAALTSVWLP